VEIDAQGGEVELLSFEAWEMDSIW
jgi:hypothetical protein